MTPDEGEGVIVYDPRNRPPEHHCPLSTVRGFPPLSVWKCGECGTLWQLLKDGRYQEWVPLHRLLHWVDYWKYRKH